MASAVLLPAPAQAAPASEVASAMATFAEDNAGADAEICATAKKARLLARREAEPKGECDDCADGKAPDGAKDDGRVV